VIAAAPKTPASSRALVSGATSDETWARRRPRGTEPWASSPSTSIRTGAASSRKRATAGRRATRPPAMVSSCARGKAPSPPTSSHAIVRPT